MYIHCFAETIIMTAEQSQQEDFLRNWLPATLVLSKLQEEEDKEEEYHPSLPFCLNQKSIHCVGALPAVAR